MANFDKRLDRSTGNYDTLEELTAEVMKLYKTKKYSRVAMGELVGVSGATCTRVINENEVKEVDVDLNAMFNKLWVMTHVESEEDHV